jgi:preprotein translocase subunit SecG
VYTLLIVIHVFICLGLILVILMQSSKGEGLAGAFGGTSLTGAVFGGRGAATFLSKATSVMAVAFMLSCLTLAFISPARQTTSQESAVKRELQNTQSMPADDQSGALPGEGSTTDQGVQLPPESGDNQTPPAQGE